MSAGNGMNFLQERQARGLYGFLVMVCVWQTFFLGICGVWHGDQIRHVLTQRELAASSYLLEQDLLPTVIAAAWNHTEVTKEGRNWTPSTEIKLFPAGGGVFDFRPEIPYNR